jgi:hypothetical protein
MVPSGSSSSGILLPLEHFFPSLSTIYESENNKNSCKNIAFDLNTSREKYKFCYNYSTYLAGKTIKRRRKNTISYK